MSVKMEDGKVGGSSLAALRGKNDLAFCPQDEQLLIKKRRETRKEIWHVEETEHDGAQPLTDQIPPLKIKPLVWLLISSWKSQPAARDANFVLQCIYLRWWCHSGHFNEGSAAACLNIWPRRCGRRRRVTVCCHNAVMHHRPRLTRVATI